MHNSKNKNKHSSALISALPSLNSYNEFCKDNDTDLEIKNSLVQYAYKNNLIDKPDETKLREFIEENTINNDTDTLKMDVDFNFLKKDSEIQSTRWLTKRINSLISQFKIKLPKVSNTMFSRLSSEPANTSTKRNTLRLCAFWIGFDRPHLLHKWNYENLIFLCPEEQKFKSNEGVKVEFSLHNRGDVINEKTIRWFRNELKDCLKFLKINYANNSSDKSYKMTEFSLNLPKENIEEEGFSRPESYIKPMHDAMAIAHQMSIRWSLSPHNTQRKFLAIGIAAGELTSLDMYLQTIINLQLPKNHIIRLTDFAHQCVLVNGIKVIFHNNPKEICMMNGEYINTWCINAIWHSLYFDFVPVILKDSIMQPDKNDNEELKRLIWFSDKSVRSDNIEFFLKNPYNSLLGLEIAKTLFHRRLFWAANYILEIVLSATPNNLSARSMRMVNFVDAAMRTQSYAVSRIQFERFTEEANFILHNFKHLDEDFLTELALGEYLHALLIFKLIRKHGGQYLDKNIKLDKSDVIQQLEKAESYLKKGFTVPTTGYRPFYWLLRVESLKTIVKTYEHHSEKEAPIYDTDEIFINISDNYFSTLGFFPKDILKQRLFSIVEGYSQAVSLSSMKPNVLFSIATFFWDFYPELDVGIAKYILQKLSLAYELTENIKKDQICIYSITGSNLITANQFQKQIKMSINEITKRIGTLVDLEKKKESEIIDRNKIGGFKLYLFHIWKWID
ncbi:hypothetical protein MHK_008449 [Candidatus Magnetomorum sp. HK-1]|nr:hypothetical protein MHK_008449 [Candidatus Magnetomorum sp. HK-1]